VIRPLDGRYRDTARDLARDADAKLVAAALRADIRRTPAAARELEAAQRRARIAREHVAVERRAELDAARGAR
jgi:hypothetical protein